MEEKSFLNVLDGLVAMVAILSGFFALVAVYVKLRVDKAKIEESFMAVNKRIDLTDDEIQEHRIETDSKFAELNTQLETNRKENREEHQHIVDSIDNLKMWLMNGQSKKGGGTGRVH